MTITAPSFGSTTASSTTASSTIASSTTGVRLAGARLWAAQRFPYFATGLFALTLVERPDIGSVTADSRWRVYADPEVVATLTTAQLGTALVHHLGHLLRDHARRGVEAGAADIWSDQWNLVADCEIDDDLVADGGRFAEPPRLPSDFGWEDSQLAETYLTLLTRQPAPEDGGDDDDCSDSDDSAIEGPAGQDADGGTNDQGEEGSGEGADSDSGSDAGSASEGASGTDSGTDSGASSGTPTRPRTIDCGSAAHGQARPWEATDDDAPALDSADAALVRRCTANAVVAHAKEFGTVPAGLLLWAQVAPATVDWRKVLASEIRRALKRTTGSSDFTFARRSRRSAALPGVILPGLFRPSPEVAVVVDTSGSMGAEELSDALGEIDGILDRAGLATRRVPVLACDAEVGAITLAARACDVDLTGGGGTDLRVGIEAATRLRPRPHVVVVLTDGCTPWPAVAPRGTSVVVGLIGEEDSWCESSVPSWARTVVIRRST